VAVCLIVFGVIAAPAAASHSWGGYHWARTANPFTVKLGDNMSATWTANLATASSDWTAAPVMDTTIVAGASNNNCRATLGRVEVCNRTYGNNGWLGLATINISGLHITQGTTKMNDTYFNTATYNNPNEKQHVVCQEVGHTFGLGHTSEDGSSQNTCMDYFSNTGANSTSTLSTHTNQHDYDELGIIYAHLDSTTTLGMVAQSPGQSGRAGATPYKTERTDSARNSTITEFFSDNTKRATFIAWAYK
jgi:hypothetical protein